MAITEGTDSDSRAGPFGCVGVRQGPNSLDGVPQCLIEKCENGFGDPVVATGDEQSGNAFEGWRRSRRPFSQHEQRGGAHNFAWASDADLLSPTP